MNIYFALAIFFALLTVAVGCGVISDLLAGVKKIFNGVKECIDEIEKGDKC